MKLCYLREYLYAHVLIDITLLDDVGYFDDRAHLGVLHYQPAGGTQPVACVDESSTRAPSKARWAERLMRVHGNTIENLVRFAPLVLTLNGSGVSTATTAAACTMYFFTRLSHLFLYTFGAPFLRTVAFFTGFLCPMALGLSILGIF